MPRLKDGNWDITEGETKDSAASTEEAILATLMDIRDELKLVNRVLGCPNCLDIPHVLRAIKKNTTKRRPKKAAATSKSN